MGVSAASAAQMAGSPCPAGRVTGCTCWTRCTASWRPAKRALCPCCSACSMAHGNPLGKLSRPGCLLVRALCPGAAHSRPSCPPTCSTCYRRPAASRQALSRAFIGCTIHPKVPSCADVVGTATRSQACSKFVSPHSRKHHCADSLLRGVWPFRRVP